MLKLTLTPDEITFVSNMFVNPRVFSSPQSPYNISPFSASDEIVTEHIVALKRWILAKLEPWAVYEDEAKKINRLGYKPIKTSIELSIKEKYAETLVKRVFKHYEALGKTPEYADVYASVASKFGGKVLTIDSVDEETISA